MLKDEFPGYFWLRTQLMEPIFHTFYFLQLRIYGILLDRIDPLSRSGYYDLTMDVIRGYETRKGDIAPTLESVEMITKRSAGASKSNTISVSVRSKWTTTPIALIFVLRIILTGSENAMDLAHVSKYGRTSVDEPSAPSSYGGSSASLDFKPQSPPSLPVAKPWQSPSAVKPWQQAAAPPPQTAPKPWQSAGTPTSPAPVTTPKPWQSAGTPTSPPVTTPKPWQAPALAPPTAPKLWQAPSRSAPDSSPPPPYSSPKPAPTPPVASVPLSASVGNGPNIHVHVNPFNPSIMGAVAATAAGAAIQASKSTVGKKPPPPPVPRRLNVKMAVALYDYDAQQDGDLSFKKDDRIEIVERTDSAQDWWTGKLNGRQGVFPGKAL